MHPSSCSIPSLLSVPVRQDAVSQSQHPVASSTGCRGRCLYLRSGRGSVLLVPPARGERLAEHSRPIALRLHARGQKALFRSVLLASADPSQCGFLDFALPSQISYPNSTTYSLEESGYWSQQQALTKPTCRFSPKSALDVSFAVLTLQVAQCEFAVKSGGHAAFEGASNIQGGMTIDLANLNEITVRSDRAQTAVGAGNIWYDVYTTLQPMGLTVIGGRVSAIGVGGLTLGGGISFFSGRYGWACDNVNNYEVVLADGSIQEVSFSSPYSDLYWALRGGGNNFGIVTRFDLMTFPQGDLWAGSETFIYTPETAAAINDAFYYLGVNAPSDPYAQVITAYAYAQSVDTYIIASDLQYGKPVANPPILQNFTAVQGAIASTLRIVDQANLTIEFNNTNPGGFRYVSNPQDTNDKPSLNQDCRQTYWTLMVGNNATLMADMVAIYMDEIEPLKTVAGIVPSLVFQPITTDMISHFSKNGGNALGLDDQGPLNRMCPSIPSDMSY